MSISDRIKEERIKLGMNQRELAESIGVSLDAIRSLETGRRSPSDETLSKLSNIFKCPIDYLIEGKPEKGFYPVHCQIDSLLKQQDRTIEWLSDVTGITLRTLERYSKMQILASLQDAKLISLALHVQMDSLYIWEIVNEEQFIKMRKRKGI